MKAGSVLFNAGLTLYSVSFRTGQEGVNEEEEDYLDKVGGDVGEGGGGRHQGDFKVEIPFSS